MQTAFGNPGLHRAAETTRTTAWLAQQYFAAQAYETIPLASFAWDCAQQVRLITLTANSAVVFPTNAKRGGVYILVVKQDTTGSRTLSYTNQAAGLGSGTWKWPAGSAPTLTTTASKIDVLTFIFDGTDMLGVSQLNY